MDRETTGRVEDCGSRRNSSKLPAAKQNTALPCFTSNERTGRDELTCDSQMLGLFRLGIFALTPGWLSGSRQVSNSQNHGVDWRTEREELPPQRSTFRSGHPVFRRMGTEEKAGPLARWAMTLGGPGKRGTRRGKSVNVRARQRGSEAERQRGKEVGPESLHGGCHRPSTLWRCTP